MSPRRDQISGGSDALDSLRPAALAGGKFRQSAASTVLRPDRHPRGELSLRFAKMFDQIVERSGSARGDPYRNELCKMFG